jgi:hypothetical protein
MAQWVDALIEGLAGIRDTDGQLRAVELSPRWSAGKVKDVRATVRYPATNAYFSYRLIESEKEVRLEYSDRPLLFPFRCSCLRVTKQQTGSSRRAANWFLRNSRATVPKSWRCVTNLRYE